MGLLCGRYGEHGLVRCDLLLGQNKGLHIDYMTLQFATETAIVFLSNLYVT